MSVYDWLVATLGLITGVTGLVRAHQAHLRSDRIEDQIKNLLDKINHKSQD
jgi:hypothetical protein